LTDDGNVLDLLDSEVVQVIALHAELNQRAAAKRHNYPDFEREIRDRFAAIGFTVDVNWYRFAAAGQLQDGAMPEVTITGRVPGGPPFDPDKRVHEAVHDVLGIGEEGWIHTDKDTLRNFLDGSRGHGHQH
jgi:hypothetical protein